MSQCEKELPLGQYGSVQANSFPQLIRSSSDLNPCFADAALQEVLQLKLSTWLISAGSVHSSCTTDSLVHFFSLLLPLLIFQ